MNGGARAAILVAGMGVAMAVACGGVGDLIIVGPDGGDPQSSGASSSGSGPDPAFQGAPTCPGGAFFQGDATIGGTMFPGEACLACHAAQGGPLFTMGGTVFSTGKVLDDCLPPLDLDLTVAQVVIHDANGDHPLPVLADGNFRSHAADNVTVPFTARVVYMGRERAMLGAQTSGDCNACHTAGGASGAPGRIALP